MPLLWNCVHVFFRWGLKNKQNILLGLFTIQNDFLKSPLIFLYIIRAVLFLLRHDATILYIFFHGVAGEAWIVPFWIRKLWGFIQPPPPTPNRGPHRLRKQDVHSRRGVARAMDSASLLHDPWRVDSNAKTGQIGDGYFFTTSDRVWPFYRRKIVEFMLLGDTILNYDRRRHFEVVSKSNFRRPSALWFWQNPMSTVRPASSYPLVDKNKSAYIQYWDI
jgi:hypothetical protein